MKTTVDSIGAPAISPTTPARPDLMFVERSAEMQAPPAEMRRPPHPPRRPGRHFRAGLSALALALVACSDSTPPEQPPKSTLVLPDTTGLFSPSATRTRTTVGVTLDQGRAVSAVVPTTGGSISATGTDGSRFTLVFPSGALTAATQITLTPVSGIVSLPLSGGLGAAVQLSPDGLQLARAATLTIEPARPVPVAEQAAFGWHAAGEDFHLHPIDADPAALRLHLTHFSGWGVGGGLDADVQALLDKIPWRDGDWIMQEAALVSRMLRRGDIGIDLANAVMVSIRKAYFYEILEPKLLAATSNPELIGYFDDAFAWIKEIEITGALEDEFTKEFLAVSSLYETAIRNAFDMAYAQCKDAHDFRQLARIVELAQRAIALGIDGIDFGKASSCLSFELVMESSIDVHTSTNDFRSRVRTVVPLTLAPDPSVKDKVRLAGEAPMDLLEYFVAYHASGCSGSLTKSPTAGGIEAVLLFVVDTARKGPLTTPLIQDFDLRIASSRYDEGSPGSVTLTCTPGGSSTIPTPDAFWTNYRLLNAHAEDAGQRFVGWTVTGGAPYATKRVEIPAPIGGTLTTLELRHKPE